MCGIVGFVSNTNVLSKKHVMDMLEKIKHRGPDFQNTFEDKNVFLGHARLSILDLSDLGNQPMVYKQYTIVFNGEIYNYLEIKEILKGYGHKFISNTDTEVILHAFEVWGEKCLEYFRGMWSFIIYDSLTNELFGSRDRFGIKPFYYFNNSSVFAFASEIKPLLGLPNLSTIPNFEVISSYLTVSLMNFNNQTFFGNILQLEPGYFLKYDIKNKKLTFKKYYDLTKISNSQESVSYEEFRETLNDSFKLHVRSDVPLGSCLSGGLDSSTVAASVSQLLQENKLITITAQSESAQTDESHFAKMVVEHLNIDWAKVKPKYSDFNEDIEYCLFMQEEPVESPSIFMQYCVMQKAKELNLKVMLDGQGGDEALLGYERYYSLFFAGLIKKGQLYKAFSEYIQTTRNSKLSASSLFKQFIYFNSLSMRKKHLSSRNTNMYDHYLDKGLTVLDILGYNETSLQKLQITELTKTNLPSLLKYEDRNSMVASIEARVPFVDHKVIEKALKLPLENKINDGFTKYSLRKYINDKLPKEIVWRRDKKGFEAPNDIWLKQHINNMQNEIEQSKLVNEIFHTKPILSNMADKELWKMYNLALWERQYLKI